MSREQTLPNWKKNAPCIRTGAEFHRSREDVRELSFALVAPLSAKHNSSHIETFDSSQRRVVVEK